MKVRAAFLVGAGVGFLVGTPAGRRQVEWITERVNALLGEEGPWSGPTRERPGGRRARPVATAALSSKVAEAARAAALNSKVVEAARTAARAAAAVVPRIIRPVSPQPSEHLMGYGMPAQREPLDQGRDGNGHENGSEQ